MTGDALRESPAIRAALNGYEPTDEQWDAIKHPLEPVHLVAGAGSGKTAVMAARIVWTIEAAGFPPTEILGLTFTNKAAEELQTRVRTAIAAAGAHRPEDIEVQTYHAFAARIVKENGLLVGVEPEAGLLSEAQQFQLVISCIDDLPAFDAIDLRSAAGIARATLGLAGSISDHVASIGDIIAVDDRVLATANPPGQVQEASAKRRELCQAVQAYVEAKRRTQRIDYGDQVVKAVEVLENFADVCASYQARYPVVLLDEYQDTNVAQRRLVTALVGDRGTITAVGDARQAIYAWRGATMYNLIGFPGHFPKSDGTRDYKPIPLSENFRSGAAILEVANRVVAGIDPTRSPGDDLRPMGDNGSGHVALGLFTHEGAEVAYIADQIEALHGRPTMTGREPVKWKDNAILVRRKRTIDAVYEELKRRDIPVEVIGLAGLLRTPEVMEVVAWLRCLEGRPTANRWLARILLGPRWRIHYRDLALCARWVAESNQELRLRLAGGDEVAARELEPGEVGVSLWEAFDHIDEIAGLGDQARSRLKAFHNKLGVLRRSAGGPLLETVQEVISRSGIADALDATRSRSAPAARQNLSNLLDHVAAFSPIEGEATLGNFLDYLDAADEAEETLEAVQPAESDSVKLMTVHAAKGLEFECVFVPSVAASEGKSGKVWSIFPNERTSNPLTSYTVLPYEVREDRDHLPKWEGKLSRFAAAVRERTVEDERRLFYVALTRAKQRLFVTAAHWYERDRTPKGPSEFWEELEGMASDGLVKVVARAEPPESNPMLASLRGVDWPPSPRTDVGDPLFEAGVGPTADAVVGGSASVDDLVASLSEAERADYDRLVSERSDELAAIAAANASTEPSPEPAVPDVLSATGFVSLTRGQIEAWDLVRPLPSRPTAARRIGTEVHRIIEERTRGIAPYPEESELDTPSEVTDPSGITDMLKAFEDRYGARTIATLPSGEPMIELPFSLKRGDKIIRGRIDAVYETDDGGLEIVDFKTGKRFERAEDEADQLAIYAEALKANGLVLDDRKLTLEYAFLSGLPPSSPPMG